MVDKIDQIMNPSELDKNKKNLIIFDDCVNIKNQNVMESYYTRGSKEEVFMTPLPAGALRLEESNNHMANFFDCVRSRKDPIAHVEQGHRSAVVGHLIIIAMQLGRKLQWDPAKEVFTGEGAKEANTHLAREMRKPYDYSYVA